MIFGALDGDLFGNNPKYFQDFVPERRMEFFWVGPQVAPGPPLLSQFQKNTFIDIFFVLMCLAVTQHQHQHPVPALSRLVMGRRQFPKVIPTGSPRGIRAEQIWSHREK